MWKRKVGRPVMAGERYPSGRLRPSNGQGGALWRRIVDEGIRFGYVNPQLGSEVGRLLFYGQITSIEAAAAARVAEIYGRYERIHGKRRDAASPSYQVGFKTYEIQESGMDAASLRRYNAKVKSATRKFDELQAAIPLIPSSARALLEQLCVDDRSIGPTHLVEVRVLLRELAVLFRFAKSNAGPVVPIRVGPARTSGA